MRKVRVISLPSMKQGGQNKYFNKEVFNQYPKYGEAMSQPNTEVNSTMKGTSPEKAVLEAEDGEQIVGNIDGTGIPSKFRISGKRHFEGGTFLSKGQAPDNSFIFSRDKKMKIKDEELLKSFGVSKPSTPADIAKKYDLNKFKKVLGDKNSNDIQISTAEKMIGNYNLKLGKLALVQESMKGFPSGVPFIAQPYVDMVGINPEMFLKPKQGELDTQQEIMASAQHPEMAQYGGQKRKVRVLPKAQFGNKPIYPNSPKYPGYIPPQEEAEGLMPAIPFRGRKILLPIDPVTKQYIGKKAASTYPKLGQTLSYGVPEENENTWQNNPAFGIFLKAMTSNKIEDMQQGYKEIEKIDNDWYDIPSILVQEGMKKRLDAKILVTKTKDLYKKNKEYETKIATAISNTQKETQKKAQIAYDNAIKNPQNTGDYLNDVKILKDLKRAKKPTSELIGHVLTGAIPKLQVESTYKNLFGIPVPFFQRYNNDDIEYVNDLYKRYPTVTKPTTDEEEKKKVEEKTNKDVVTPKSDSTQKKVEIIDVDEKF